MACPHCDLLHRSAPPKAGTLHLCARCGAVLARGGRSTLEQVLALHVAALVLFALANAFPLLTLNLRGTVRAASIPGCVRILAGLGWPWLSAILLTTVVLGPLAHMSGMMVVLGQLLLRRPQRWTGRLFRILEELRAWGMTEVFVLGILVSYAKLGKMAMVRPGPALAALAAFMVVAALAASSLDPRAIWATLGDPGPTGPLPPDSWPTARRAHLVSCPACGRLAPDRSPGPCPRCGASLASRKHDGATRAWALLITSAILYLPANLMPVTRVESLGRAHTDTILSGVGYFLRTGSWPLAVIIFVASVLVPLLKFVGLTYLLLSVRFRSRTNLRQRARLYRLSEDIGRWSMVDIFAITLMVALLQVGSLASIVPRPGAMAFALVVVGTILAVRFFDPRSIWDVLEAERG